MNGKIRFRGEYETQTDIIQISGERMENGAVGELMNRDNFGFRFQVQYTVPHEPMLEQIHKVSFFDNGELKEEITLSREDILNIIAGSDTGSFLLIIWSSFHRGKCFSMFIGNNRTNCCIHWLNYIFSITWVWSCSGELHIDKCKPCLMFCLI